MARSIAAERRGARVRRHARVRQRVAGTAVRPRLAVYRSLRHIYAQVIDDDAGHTLVAASTAEPALSTDLESAGRKSMQAALIGRLIADRARSAGIDAVVFDRGGYRYHGRVRALAEAAREAGLRF